MSHIDKLTTEFYKKWNLYEYYHIDQKIEIKHHKLFEISSSPIFKEIFRNHFNIDINDDNASLIVERDLKISSILL